MQLATYLDPLVGVAHHGDEEVDEDDDGDEEVDQEDDLEEDDRPLAHVRAQLQVLGAGQAEEAEDQQVEGLRDGHREAACKENVALFGYICTGKSVPSYERLGVKCFRECERESYMLLL